MEYVPREIIGHGSFGVIRKVIRSDGVVLARKEISYKSMNQKERTQLISEFRILKSLVHPNIVHYLHHEHVPESQEVHLYMEYCGGGDLGSIIRNIKASDGYFPENEVWNVLTQMCLALYRCHYNTDAAPQPASILSPESNNNKTNEGLPQSFVLHRDIKPENIFLDVDKPYSKIKLGDFGLAKLLDGDHPLATTYVGTPYYMSPEVLTDQPSTPASDIWSLGCVIYELCAKHPPFQAKSHLQLCQRVQEGKIKPLPSYYSHTLARTVAACLQISPSHRPTAATLLNLDIIKISRKEIELKERQYLIQKREEELDHVVTRLNTDLENVIQEEVERRVEQRQQQPGLSSPLARKLLHEKSR